MLPLCRDQGLASCPGTGRSSPHRAQRIIVPAGRRNLDPGRPGETAVPARVSAADDRAGEVGLYARGSVAAVRADGAVDPEWVEQAGLDEGRRDDGLTTAERDELKRLRRENQTLREERRWPRRRDAATPSSGSASYGCGAATGLARGAGGAPGARRRGDGEGGGGGGRAKRSVDSLSPSQ